MPALVKALNKVDLPTLGRPTIPHFRLMSVPGKQARKCMRCVAARAWSGLPLAWVLLAAALALPAGPAWAQLASSRIQPVVLRDAQESVPAESLGLAWIDA